MGATADQCHGGGVEMHRGAPILASCNRAEEVRPAPSTPITALAALLSNESPSIVNYSPFFPLNIHGTLLP